MMDKGEKNLKKLIKNGVIKDTVEGYVLIKKDYVLGCEPLVLDKMLIIPSDEK